MVINSVNMVENKKIEVALNHLGIPFNEEF